MNKYVERYYVFWTGLGAACGIGLGTIAPIAVLWLMWKLL